MDISTLLSALNPAQRDAVTADSQHLLVLAGAGSGKTRVLTTRIAYFCQNYDLSPWSVMAVTFTNKAATELRARLEQLLGMPTKQLWIGTFHGLAHRFLRTHWADAGLPQNFWAQWQANHALFPQGVDIIFCCSDRAVGLPRSTRVQTLKGA